MIQVKIRILLVDDDNETREVMRSALEAEFGRELSLVEAVDGADASIKIERQAFDCIITDLNMPKKSGEEFILDTRESRLNAKVPIILITGFAQEIDLKSHSFVSMIEKPFKSSVLIEEVKNQLKQGSLDQRLNQRLLNLISEQCARIFNEVFKTQPNINKAAMRVAQQSLQGDFNAKVNIRAPFGEDLFFISYDHKILSNAKDIFKNLNPAFENANEVAMAKAFTKYIFEQLKTSDLFKNENMQILAIESANNTDMEKSKDLIQLRSLYILMESDKGNLCIYAIL